MTGWQKSTEQERIRRGVRACLALALALPPLFLANLYGFFLRARVHLGAWPRPYHPDPKDLPFEHAHRWLILASGLAMLLSPLALAAVAAFRPLSLRERIFVQRVGVAFATLYVLTIAFTRADPLRVLEWFLD